jgi:3-methyladenine DNA glycosylase AlkD
VNDFEAALEGLKPWREDTNHWVRRTVGVAVHYWAKRSRGEGSVKAKRLLTFLEPVFEEKEIQAVEGIGWGLKTLGRYYPELLADWLAVQVVQKERSYHSVTLRKALTYLSEDQRKQATGGRIR